MNDVQLLTLSAEIGANTGAVATVDTTAPQAGDTIPVLLAKILTVLGVS